LLAAIAPAFASPHQLQLGVFFQLGDDAVDLLAASRRA
jgi:hypothetical protein